MIWFLVIFFSSMSICFVVLTIKFKNKIIFSTAACVSLVLVLLSSQSPRIVQLVLTTGKTKMEAQLNQVSQEQQLIKRQIELIIALVKTLETKPLILSDDNTKVRPEIDSLSKLLQETK
jgi:peptidoglycan hydrolase CwlO-like protein